jgi:16S rRNA (cytidine1402-2'-O)-methyltransferase
VIQPATLYVVATPIGNLEDITLRALRVLREVDRVACEDTRVTARLFAEHQIATPLMRHESHNEAASTAGILELLERGESIALVSDAGTPTVRDPGERLVKAALEAGHEVVTIPGPSALLAAVAVSGLPAEPLTFHGFLPKKTGERERALEALGPGTHAFFCPARDLEAAVASMIDTIPKAGVAIGRELTKQHETWYRGAPDRVAVLLDENASRGEAVVLLSVSAEDAEVTDTAISEALGPLLVEGLGSKKATAAVALALAVSKRRVYQLALALRNPEA